MTHKDGGTERARAVMKLFIAQSGVARREQLHDLGVAPRTIRRRIAEQVWLRRGKRVVVLGGTAPGLLTESLIAAHTVFPDGELTGHAALAVRGLADRDPWNCVPAPGTPWVRIDAHRSIDALLIRERPGRAQHLLGVPTAGVDQIAVDLLRFLPPDDARTLLYRLAQEQRSATLATRIDAAVAALGRRKGTGQLRQLAEALATGAHSDAELELIRLVRDAGLTGFAPNYPVTLGGHHFRIDLAFPEHGLAIEVDGRAFHSDTSRFQSDRARQNRLIAAGWRVLRFTWQDLTTRPEHVLEQITLLLAD